MNLAHDIALAGRLADAAGGAIRPFFRADYRHEAKSDASPVTDADRAAEAAMRRILLAERPMDAIQGEEEGRREGTSGRTWVLDPIDGTNNYALGIPLTAISLGLMRDGEPVYGFLYDLGRRCLFHGGPGQGVWMDDTRLQPKFGRSGRHERIVATHSPIEAGYLSIATAILTQYKLRGFGSGALHLTYASLGIIDVCMDFTVKVWDIAAATAIARETGAKMHFWGPSPYPLQKFDLKMKPIQYCAGSPDAIDGIVELVNKNRG